ncbi:hypothetical protein RAZWK3B_14733 [Roseobacter sp. AzwK-3b]|uniref:vWA domain-containing protein n=1 Tax=Roseobacter sp. AzwK-3b TaxID=351016 RepID=UPI0001569D50|nr:VWA domain-containing protein [Roseobacter sp. AzwK-3b]EDM70662.1 hypothetical protein RAZWK3B_14733 [Roseobacter sp. AzwK-3b]
MIELKITPQVPARLEGHANTLNALIRIVAPSAPVTETEPRPPLNLALVLDRSSSMRGQPLHEAKRAADQIVAGLRPSDRLAIVAFDNATEVMFSGGPRGDGQAARAALSRIHARGMTALHDGWLLGVEQSIAMREAGTPARVFLLSDGVANVGLTDASAIAADCTRMAEHGITTSTCGLGMGFNEDLMAEMARAGRGNAYYGETAEDLQDPFEQEFDLLRNICARGLRLRLSAGAGVEMRVLNQYPERDGEVLLPDLAFDGEAWAMVELQFDESDEQPGDRLLLSAEVTGQTPDGDAISDGPASLRLPRLPASAFDMITQEEIVQARARELRAADLQERARLAARRHDWDQVQTLIDEAQRESGENAWVAESLGTLRELAARRELEGFSKEAMYSSRAMRTRLGIAAFEDERIWNAETESAKPSYLRRKLAQGKRMQTRDKRQD